VHPIGFPMKLSVSGKDLSKDYTFTVGDVEKGSMKGEVVAYVDILSDLFSGAEGIFREPHGCFEQTSSSTFPNILALQFLRETNQIRPDVERKALDFIERGYERLISYEVKGGGFDWFGHPPAHEALTAYGLIEFHEMKKVFPRVSDAMIDRTRDWLLSRRQGDGTFKTNSSGFDDFGRPAPTVASAYIVYALSETGMKSLDLEYQKAYDEAWDKKDMYRLALTANSAYNLKKQSDYENLVEFFETEIQDNPEKLTADHSIVWSQGMSLENETLALWTTALLKSPEGKLDLIQKCIKTISGRRSYGMFGSTQATILCLKALTEYAKVVQSNRQPGELVVASSKGAEESFSYTASTRDKISLSQFTSDITEGANNLSVRFRNTNAGLPYSINLGWNTKTPVSSENCKVRITTTMKEKSIRLNETVRFSIVVKNTSHTGVPMTMAVVGIPAGLSLQPWQLKELQEKNVFDFYEIIGDRLALYYRQMKGSETRTINLDLKADVPGTFTSVASSAYLYYTDEFKHWVSGSKVTVLP
jgi:alpha-2-macroglobulin-like protein